MAVVMLDKECGCAVTVIETDEQKIYSARERILDWLAQQSAVPHKTRQRLDRLMLEPVRGGITTDLLTELKNAMCVLGIPHD